MNGPPNILSVPNWHKNCAILKKNPIFSTFLKLLVTALFLHKMESSSSQPNNKVNMHGLNVSQYNLVIQGLFTEENDQLGIPILRERSNTLFNNVFEKLKATRVGKKLNIKS
jgi:hypothetical protein